MPGAWWSGHLRGGSLPRSNRLGDPTHRADAQHRWRYHSAGTANRIEGHQSVRPCVASHAFIASQKSVGDMDQANQEEDGAWLESDAGDETFQGSHDSFPPALS